MVLGRVITSLWMLLLFVFIVSISISSNDISIYISMIMIGIVTQFSISVYLSLPFTERKTQQDPSYPVLHVTQAENLIAHLAT